MLRKRIQLGLIHAALAMTLVPIQSTLNRVMIKELAIAATVVALLTSLPYLFSPVQVAIGSFADRHPLWGRRRIPYIVLGLFLCVAGVILSPYAAFFFAANWWAGFWLSLLAFGAWGTGFNFATVSYFSLATELSGEKGRSGTISVMFFMMILSIIFTAIGLSNMLEPYSPQALIRAFWIVGLAALGLGLVGLIGLESRFQPNKEMTAARASWADLVRSLAGNRQARLFFIYLVLLLAAILGQDNLLEPFAGQAFGLTVRETTRITSLWGTCTLFCLIVAGLLERWVSKRKVAQIGSWGAAAAFVMIVVSGVTASAAVFYLGVATLGLATGLATVSNLSLMLDMTTATGIGLFIGAWGMADALARLVGNLLGGAMRDVVTQASGNPVAGYLVVFAIEAAMLIVSLRVLRQIDVGAFRRQTEQPPVIERAALANEA